jgi:hypothetical protein
MVDVPETDIDFVPRSAKTRQFEVLEYRVEFLCLCPDCRKKNASNKLTIKGGLNADTERPKAKR